MFENLWTSSTTSRRAFNYHEYLKDILYDIDAPAELRQEALNELRQREETGKTLRWLAGLIVLSLLLVFVGQGCLIRHERAHAAHVSAQQPTTKSSTAVPSTTTPSSTAPADAAPSGDAGRAQDAGGYGTMLTATLWAIGWLSGGALVGFLFGIPRIIQPEDIVRADGTKPTAPEASNYRQRVNTNLEQISDWLTKIIVGLGLIELRRLPGLLHRAAEYMTWTGCAVTCPPFAAAIVVTLSILGFFTGYLTTRMFLASAFGRADRAGDSSRYTVRTAPTPRVESGGATSPRSAPAAVAAAQKLINRFESKPATSPSDLRDLAKAQLINGHFDQAIESYRQAVAQFPNDPAVHYEYAVALTRAEGEDSRAAIDQLLEAHKSIRRADTVMKEAIYNALVYLNLFHPDRKGYLDSIRFGEEYLQSHGTGSGELFINLACAYAQAFRDEQIPGKKAQLRDKAVDAMVRAKPFGEWYRQRLVLLLTPDKEKPEGLDDLEVFQSDQKVREVLGLS